LRLTCCQRRRWSDMRWDAGLLFVATPGITTCPRFERN
jgi:hypothetical protein